ncbi:MAG: dipeptidase [Sorangiineae bacterium]|nr:dipeptidase [Polyangiaceae bacterium]MEB2324504.1 dipeptidase [Sorangiineae bacterium]
MTRFVLLCSSLALAGCSHGGAPEPPPRPLAPTATAPSLAVSPAPSAAPPAPAAPAPSQPQTPEARARELAHRLIIVDGHIDVPERLDEGRDAKGNLTEDVTQATERGDFDYPRARAGGLDAPFFSIYVPSRYDGGGAKRYANQLLDLVDALFERAPDKFARAGSPEEVRKNFAAGKMTLLLGLENGSPVERELANVRHFYDRGVRYITLAHARDNQLADSSYDWRRKNRGLSKLGVEVVKEMNRVGVLVDVSHLSDEAFWGVLKASAVPVIASHSSCRAFTPGFARNMSDDMIRALAKAGGIIMINFGSGFVDGEIQKDDDRLVKERRAFLAERGARPGSPEERALKEEFARTHPHRRATVEQVARHIEHVIEIAGVEHVGLGSDFDGLGDTLPVGLEDVSKYPNLIRVLLERGRSEADLEKILSGNLFRVWKQTLDYGAAGAGPAK